jgi:hypothetical protein
MFLNLVGLVWAFELALQLGRIILMQVVLMMTLWALVLVMVSLTPRYQWLEDWILEREVVAALVMAFRLVVYILFSSLATLRVQVCLVLAFQVMALPPTTSRAPILPGLLLPSMSRWATTRNQLRMPPAQTTQQHH